MARYSSIDNTLFQHFQHQGRSASFFAMASSSMNHHGLQIIALLPSSHIRLFAFPRHVFSSTSSSSSSSIFDDFLPTAFLLPLLQSSPDTSFDASISSNQQRTISCSCCRRTKTRRNSPPLYPLSFLAVASAIGPLTSCPAFCHFDPQTQLHQASRSCTIPVLDSVVISPSPGIVRFLGTPHDLPPPSLSFLLQPLALSFWPP